MRRAVLWAVAARLVACAAGAHRLLVAMPTHRNGGHPYIDASHEWRADVDSFVLTSGNATREIKRTHRAEDNTTEVWLEHPDGGPECVGCDACAPPDKPCNWTCPIPSSCGWCGPHGCRFHEQRYTITPSLANLTFWGSYDWLLMADGETVWFADNMRAMLRDLDPAVPYYFSASMYPGSDACCAFPSRPEVIKGDCVWAPHGNPACTWATILNASTCASRHADDPATAAHPRAPAQIWNGGNWGLVLSRGLMGRITPEQWLDCVKCINGFHCYGGGDVRIGECVWWHGFAPTLPDQDDSGKENERLGAPLALLDAYARWADEGKCDAECVAAMQQPLAINVNEMHQFKLLDKYGVLKRLRNANTTAPAP